jgi:hypothetical protein
LGKVATELLAQNDSAEWRKRWREASADYARASGVTDLYAPGEICAMLQSAQRRFFESMGDHSASVAVIQEIGPQIVELARKDLLQNP